MLDTEKKALVSLLDDSDVEVLDMVSSKIKQLGAEMIPYLEEQFASEALSPVFQKKIEELLNSLHHNNLTEKLLTWKRETPEDLLMGLWTIASFQYPNLELQTLREEINKIKFETWLELREDIHPYDQVKILNYVFFQKFGFEANNSEFHSVSNSMINSILSDKKSNPIGLCMVYMMVAQELGIPIYGVNLPNVFVLIFDQPNLSFFINVFGGGVILSKKEIENHLTELKITAKPSFFTKCSNYVIIMRVLRNLHAAYEKAEDHYKMTVIESVLKTLIKDNDSDSSAG